MGMDFELAAAQVTQILNAGIKDSSGNAEFSDEIGDPLYSKEEILNNCINAGEMVLLAILETDGHPQRSAFMENVEVDYKAAIPIGFGSFGTPEITPYENAPYTVAGVELSPEEIESYRQNPRRIYCAVNHDQSYPAPEDEPDTVREASDIAGFYAVDGLKFYFTGFSAIVPVARFDREDIYKSSDKTSKIPEGFHSTVVKLAAGLSGKDGMLSDIAGFYNRQGLTDLALIRGGKEIIPKIVQYQNSRGTGAQ